MTSYHLPLWPGWTSRRLKALAAINETALSADTDPDYEFEYLEISNVDYFGIIDETEIERIRFDEAPSRARRRVPQNSIVISSVRPNLQAAAFIADHGPDFVSSTGFNVVQPFAELLVPRFGYYVLISEHARQFFESAAKGVGYPAIDDKDFHSLVVPLPPLSEQERIVSFLDTSCAAIDGAAAVKRRQLRTLDALRRSVISRAVVYGTAQKPKLRRVDHDWLREIPSHWHVCRLKRVLARLDYGISEKTNEEGRYSVLKMGHLTDGEITFSNLDFVDDVNDNLLLDTGDLLYNRTNSPDQVGKAAVFRKCKAEGVTFASYLVRLRVNRRASPWFLNYVLNSDCFLGFARRLAIPSVQQSNLNSTRYARLFVPLPPFEEQEAIRTFLDEKVAELRRASSRIERQLATLRAYRKSLIHECVTGKRRVTDADVRAISQQPARVAETASTRELAHA